MVQEGGGVFMWGLRVVNQTHTNADLESLQRIVDHGGVGLLVCALQPFTEVQLFNENK